jgi:hypothetical protein
MVSTRIAVKFDPLSALGPSLTVLFTGPASTVESEIVSEPEPEVVMDPLIREFLIWTPVAFTCTPQLIVFASITVFGVPIVHGPA